MNVLVIESDQQRWDALGVNSGGLVKTPNLDALAARGANFINAYANSPVCCPSRASQITGRWCHEISAYCNATPWEGGVKTYAHYLTQEGISADDIGKMDLSPEADHGFGGFRHGPRKKGGDPFEFMRDPMAQRVGGYRDEVFNTSIVAEDWKNAENVCDWIRERAEKDGPWHLYYTNILPHPPYEVPQSFYDMYSDDEIPMPERAEDDKHVSDSTHRYSWRVDERFSDDFIRERRRYYFAMTSWLDKFVGDIMKTLEEAGQLDNTLIIFTSDHGEHLGDHDMWSKGSFYDSAARVPLLMAGPGVPAGRTIDAPVSLIDIAPTIMDAFRLEKPREFHGHSLLPLARGEEDGKGRYVLGTYHGHDTSTGQFMVRKDQWKYIYCVGQTPRLFNLDDDPAELHNLHGTPELEHFEIEFESLLRADFDMEAIDAEAKRYQHEKFQEWKEIIGDRLEEVLRNELGDEQYEELRPIYDF